MRKIIIFFVMTIVAPAFAGSGSESAFEAIFRGLASIGDGKSSGKDGVGAALRLSGGYTNGSIRDDDFDKTVVTGFDRNEGTYGEADFGGVFSLHFGVSKTLDRQSQLNFKNAGLKKAEIESTRYQYGIKLIGPSKRVQPYLGGGYITGPMRMKEMGTNNEYTQMLYGLYWNAGFDMMFGSHMGIRLGYQSEDYLNAAFSDLNNESMTIKVRSGRAGLLFYF